MATILIISFSDLKRDPRVYRQIKALRPHHTVITAGTGDPGLPDVRFISCNVRPRSIQQKTLDALTLIIGRHDFYYWNMLHIVELDTKLQELRFDLAIANDIEALPLALKVAQGSPVILDAHEYSPLEFEDRWWWRWCFAPYATDMCRRYMRKAATVTTVCQGIADRYEKEFGIRAEVITNAPHFHDLSVRPTEGAAIRLIHHGAAIASRRIELMIELMDYLDERFSLDFVLVPGKPEYLEWIRHCATGKPKIRFLQPVPMNQLVTLSSQYDIGLFLLPPTNFNYEMALPNKFFEFLQARLAVAIGPSPEMGRIVREFECGVVAEDFTPRSLAGALSALTTQDIDRMKKGADRAAHVHHAENNDKRLCALIDSVIAGGR